MLSSPPPDPLKVLILKSIPLVAVSPPGSSLLPSHAHTYCCCNDASRSQPMHLGAHRLDFEGKNSIRSVFHEPFLNWRQVLPGLVFFCL